MLNSSMTLNINNHSFIITKAHIKESLEDIFVCECEGFYENLKEDILDLNPHSNTENNLNSSSNKPFHQNTLNNPNNQNTLNDNTKSLNNNNLNTNDKDLNENLSNHQTQQLYCISPFLRVATPVASHQSGFYHTPRVADEVIISYLKFQTLCLQKKTLDFGV